LAPVDDHIIKPKRVRQEKIKHQLLATLGRLRRYETGELRWLGGYETGELRWRGFYEGTLLFGDM
jgi:hypothetical protein